MTLPEVETLLSMELARMPEIAREAVRPMLATPRAEQRTWSYGPGEFACWRVATDATRSVSVVYLVGPGGFRDRWGLVETESGDLGSDDRWHVSLYDAAIAAGWVTPPPGYEVP
jgi:hypothetical protein